MSGTVGPPISGTEFRFEGSAELGYDPLGTPPRGELCLRGPQIFSGYYKDAEKTKEAVGEFSPCPQTLVLNHDQVQRRHIAL